MKNYWIEEDIRSVAESTAVALNERYKEHTVGKNLTRIQSKLIWFRARYLALNLLGRENEDLARRLILTEDRDKWCFIITKEEDEYSLLATFRSNLKDPSLIAGLRNNQ